MCSREHRILLRLPNFGLGGQLGVGHLRKNAVYQNYEMRVWPGCAQLCLPFSVSGVLYSHPAQPYCFHFVNVFPLLFCLSMLVLGKARQTVTIELCPCNNVRN